MSERVIVFIDEKNVYKCARSAFFEGNPHFTRGNFHPVQLAKLIVNRLPIGVAERRVLEEVRIYTGTPSSSIEPKSYGANMKQRSSWTKAGAVVISRPLRYLKPVPPGDQKGVDVALAVDFVTLALENRYDVGIIFSVDTDLKPALEYVVGKTDFPRAEVACWWSSKGSELFEHRWHNRMEPSPNRGRLQIGV